MTTTNTLRIRSVNSLAVLGNEIRRGRLRQFRRIAFEVNEFSADDNQLWQRKIERLYFSCGCSEGAIASVGALLAYMAWLFLRPAGIGAISWTDAIWGLLLFFLAAGLGKVVGLARSRRNLIEAIDQLDQVLRQKGATGLETTLPEEPPTRTLCAVR
jgi:hypothetical protein